MDTMTGGRRRLALALFGAAATLALTAAPYGIGADGFAPQAATAAPGNKGGSNSDRGNSGNSGSGNSGSDKSGRGHSAGDKGNSGNKGRGGETSPGTGPGPASTERGGATSNSGRRGNEYVNPQTGTRLEIDGSNVEVVHRDGIREEIAGGRYRMRDAQGRLIIERIATESDRGRFRAMVR